MSSINEVLPDDSQVVCRTRSGNKETYDVVKVITEYNHALGRRTRNYSVAGGENQRYIDLKKGANDDQ